MSLTTKQTNQHFRPALFQERAGGEAKQGVRFKVKTPKPYALHLKPYASKKTIRKYKLIRPSPKPYTLNPIPY